MRDNRLRQFFYLMAGIVALALLLWSLSRSSRPTTKPLPPDLPAEFAASAAPTTRADLETLERLLASVRPGSQISVVRFTSKEGNGQPGWKHGCTRIHGTFTLAAQWTGEPLSWSETDREVPGVRPTHYIYEWRHRGSFGRIEELFPTGDERKKPHLFLAVSRGPTTDPLACDFVGSISARDYRELPELAETLSAEPFVKMAVGRAEALLDSPNSWLRLLGLARLADMRVLTARHFGRTFRSCSLEDMELLGQELSHAQAAKPAPSEEGLEEVCLANDLSAEKQEILLKILVLSLQGQGPLCWNLDVPHFQAAAREYLRTLADEPQRAGVVRLLEQAIHAESKPFTPRQPGNVRALTAKELKGQMEWDPTLKKGTFSGEWGGLTVQQILDRLVDATGAELSMDEHVDLDRPAFAGYQLGGVDTVHVMRTLTESPAVEGRWVEWGNGYRLLGSRPVHPEPPPSPSPHAAWIWLGLALGAGLLSAYLLIRRQRLRQAG